MAPISHAAAPRRLPTARHERPLGTAQDDRNGEDLLHHHEQVEARSPMTGLLLNRSNHAPTEWLAGGGTAMKSATWSGTQMAVKIAPPAAARGRLASGWWCR